LITDETSKLLIPPKRGITKLEISIFNDSKTDSKTFYGTDRESIITSL